VLYCCAAVQFNSSMPPSSHIDGTVLFGWVLTFVKVVATKFDQLSIVF
jgi:hypothetical protein